MTEVGGGGSATFEPCSSDSGGGIELSAEPPAAKRARFEATADLAPEAVTEIAVGGEDGQEEVHHLTVPQTQFEIEINSGSVEDEDGVVRETILPQDLNGPAFAITTASQVCVCGVACVGVQCEFWLGVGRDVKLFAAGATAFLNILWLANQKLHHSPTQTTPHTPSLFHTLQDLPSLSVLSPRAGEDSIEESDGRTLNAIGR